MNCFAKRERKYFRKAKKMKKKALKIGDVVQLNPDSHKYGGSLLIVTEPAEWGCMGYLCIDLLYDGLVRWKGRAYLRPTWDEIEFVGRAEWIMDSIPETATQEQ